MTRRLLKSIAFVAVALSASLTAVSCDKLPTDIPTTQENTVAAAVDTAVSATAEVSSSAAVSGYFFVLQPTAPTTTTSSGGGLLGGLLRTVTTLVSNTLDLVLNLTKIIGLSGGELKLLDHRLLVPRGAVTEPTAFSMRANAYGRVEVELKAERETRQGVIDVGENGFLKPVDLTLSYAKATNVRYPSRLKIVLLNDDGTIKEVLPSTVNTRTKTVTAKLPHFSRYALACD